MRKFNYLQMRKFNYIEYATIFDIKILLKQKPIYILAPIAVKIPGMRRDLPRRSVPNEGIVTKSGTGFERSEYLDAPKNKDSAFSDTKKPP